MSYDAYNKSYCILVEKISMLEEINHYYLGYMGIASAIVLSGFGAAYGTAKTAAGIF